MTGCAGRGRRPGGGRGGAALSIALCLAAVGTWAAVSDHSKNWDVELAGTVRECDDCEPVFELRATGPYGVAETFGVPAGGAAGIDEVHVHGTRAWIVQGFEGRLLHRVVLYALRSQHHRGSWSGFAAADVLAAEFSVSPDGRYVLFRPARAPGEPMDPRLYLWDTVTRTPSAPRKRRRDCGGPAAPCPPNPDLQVLLYPRPLAPDAGHARDPRPYPLHAVWDESAEDPREYSSPDVVTEYPHLFRDRLAFVALDRRDWLTLVVVSLDGVDSAVECYVPIVPYHRDPGQVGASTEEVRRVDLDRGEALVEMYGNAGVRTVHAVPVGGYECRQERDRWREGRAELDRVNESR